jgi:hypothetical protein
MKKPPGLSGGYSGELEFYRFLDGIEIQAALSSLARDRSKVNDSFLKATRLIPR